MPKTSKRTDASLQSFTKWWIRGFAVGIVASSAAQFVFYWPPQALLLQLRTNARWDLLLKWIALALFLATLFALINRWLQARPLNDAK